jgi:hypothetical protein
MYLILTQLAEWRFFGLEIKILFLCELVRSVKL